MKFSNSSNSNTKTYIKTEHSEKRKTQWETENRVRNWKHCEKLQSQWETENIVRNCKHSEKLKTQYETENTDRNWKHSEKLPKTELETVYLLMTKYCHSIHI